MNINLDQWTNLNISVLLLRRPYGLQMIPQMKTKRFTLYVEQHFRYWMKNNESSNPFVVVKQANGAEFDTPVYQGGLFVGPSALRTQDPLISPLFIIYCIWYIYIYIYIYMYIYICGVFSLVEVYKSPPKSRHTKVMDCMWACVMCLQGGPQEPGP